MAPQPGGPGDAAPHVDPGNRGDLLHGYLVGRVRRDARDLRHVRGGFALQGVQVLQELQALFEREGDVWDVCEGCEGELRNYPKTCGTPVA